MTRGVKDPKLLCICESILISKMDPISAAGIGLAVVPLVIQVFAGCIKGVHDHPHQDS